MLIPYFTVLLILSVYGLHRYDVIRTYFKHRKNATGEPPRRFEQLPPVTIQLPLYNERYVVERLIDEVVKIEYPKELLQIQVLDDSTDDTAPFAEALVERYRNMGYPIEYHHRTNRHGFKAGALQEGLKTATGEVVAVFDADFCPPAEFLTKTIHYFADPEGRSGADAVELSESRLQLPDGSGGRAAGRPLHSGARGPVARRILSSTSTALREFCGAR